MTAASGRISDTEQSLSPPPRFPPPERQGANSSSNVPGWLVWLANDRPRLTGYEHAAREDEEEIDSSKGVCSLPNASGASAIVTLP